MERPLTEAYARTAEHGAISDLIRRHSTNLRDVREVALESVDIPRGARLLDLGCGFGFMAEALACRAGTGAEVLGIDVNPTNRVRFLARVGVAGCLGRFLERELADDLGFLEPGFDGVVASYSLYFFPAIVGEIARVLHPGGFFVGLTHSEASLRTLLDLLDIPQSRAPEAAILHAFSAESGRDRLGPHFSDIEERAYANSLVFEADGLADFLQYVRFKLPLVLRGTEVGAPVPGGIVERSRALVEGSGRIVIGKDDMAFVCRGPRP